MIKNCYINQCRICSLNWYFTLGRSDDAFRSLLTSCLNNLPIGNSFLAISMGSELNESILLMEII